MTLSWNMHWDWPKPRTLSQSPLPHRQPPAPAPIKKKFDAACKRSHDRPLSSPPAGRRLPSQMPQGCAPSLWYRRTHALVGGCSGLMDLLVSLCREPATNKKASIQVLSCIDPCICSYVLMSFGGIFLDGFVWHAVLIDRIVCWTVLNFYMCLHSAMWLLVCTARIGG